MNHKGFADEVFQGHSRLGQQTALRLLDVPGRPLGQEVATVPVGHTEGYTDTAGGKCEVLIGERLFPVVTGGGASAHQLVDVGLDSPVQVGDLVTLIGREAPAILPVEVGARTGVGFLFPRTRLFALLPRRLV